MSGTTTDPRTGKIYQRKPPKARSAEFKLLEASVEDKRARLGTYMREHAYFFDKESGKSVHADGSPIEGDAALDALIGAVRAATGAVRAYKASHPREFQPEPRPTTVPLFRRPAAKEE